jgi:urease accessory protein
MLDVITPHDLTDDDGLNPADWRRAQLPTRCDSDLQRAEGVGRVALRGSQWGNQVVDLFQRSPIRIMLPKFGGGAIEEVVFANIGGGIAGGDRLESSVTALAEASIAATSQTAERVYRALSRPARVTTQLKACEASKLAWLPQETILFNRARLARTTEVELTSGAEVLALEWLVLGRTAHGEEVVNGHIADSWRVKKDGRLIWADSFRAEDTTFPYLHKQALLSTCKAFGTLVYFGPQMQARLEVLRELTASLHCHCAATSVGGLIVVRFAAECALDLRLALRGLLEHLSYELGPGPFGVPKMWSC